MNAWEIAIVSVSAIIGGMVGVKLIVWHAHFTALERFGLAMIGAGSIMTIGPVITSGGSPFANWAPLLLRLGVVILFTGHIIRYWKSGFPEVTK